MSEKFGGEQQSPAPEKKTPHIVLVRDRIKSYNEQKPDDPRGATMEVQGAKYEVALHTLMERTNDDAELVNAMNSFLDRLNHLAGLGRPGEKIGQERLAALKELFQSADRELEDYIKKFG